MPRRREAAQAPRSRVPHRLPRRQGGIQLTWSDASAAGGDCCRQESRCLGLASQCTYSVQPSCCGVYFSAQDRTTCPSLKLAPSASAGIVAPSFSIDEKPDCAGMWNRPPRCRHASARRGKTCSQRQKWKIRESNWLSLEEREEGTKNSWGWPWTTARPKRNQQATPCHRRKKRSPAHGPLRSMARLTLMNRPRPPLVELQRPFGAGHTRVLARDECL